MRSWFIVGNLALAAALVACGGGGQSMETPSDPTASWPLNVMLGTWTGVMKPTAGSCGGTDFPDRPQSLTISSSDGVSYTVKATPALDGYGPGLGLTDTQLVWTGEPAFALSLTASTSEFWSWRFNVTAPSEAYLYFSHAKTGIAGPSSCESWAGTLTRSD
jgi:hypothetical protein